jgi:hypothetical protein
VRKACTKCCRRNLPEEAIRREPPFRSPSPGPGGSDWRLALVWTLLARWLPRLCVFCVFLEGTVRSRHLSSWRHLLASFSMITPHQIDHPQPTRQKRTVKNWPTPMIRLMMKEPMRGRGPSFWEKRGLPMHRQKRPLRMVPAKNY